MHRCIAKAGSRPSHLLLSARNTPIEVMDFNPYPQHRIYFP